MRRSLAPLLLVVGAAAVHAASAPSPAISSNDLQFFETKVRPVLVDRCYKCHSKDADKVRGGLMLDTREAWLAGGNTGPAIVPGNPKESLLIQAISYKDDDLQMPPKGDKLTDQQIADLTEWVRRGAPDPRTLVAKGSSSAYGGVGKSHWAFQPAKKPAVPEVQNAAWCVNPIDNFIAAKLEANGLAPNVPADRTTLIRRLYFDLIGLPPSVRDVQAFVNDTAPDAYEKIVDKLLGSQYYGEHWARYWLDIARYSDSKGDAQGRNDLRYPHAWTYRDYVINSFNQDKPYNQFVVEQLAADRLLESANAKLKAKDKNAPEIQDRSVLAALGFLTLGNQFNGRRDDIIADQIDVTCKAFLGLTVACARCHDHKFDPIPTKDYYSLYGVFANSRVPETLPMLKADPPKTPELATYFTKAAELEKREEALRAERIEFNRSGTKSREKQQQLARTQGQISKEMGDLESSDPGAPPRANAIYDAPRCVDFPVLLRGEAANKGDIVPRRFLEILSPQNVALNQFDANKNGKIDGGEIAAVRAAFTADPKGSLAFFDANRNGKLEDKEISGIEAKNREEWHAGSGRAQLAFSIIDPGNPLTARVIVNRIWQQHWGTGFVSTPDDLGNMSSPPTHPELLDYLAATFIDEGWSLKKLHRKIVLSAAYRQAATNNPKFAELDPNNKFYWRYNLRRLDFEQMHDALLTITGELDTTYGGKSIPISSEGFAKRRAIYTLIDRENPPELLTQFDFPSPDVSSGRRYETLVPQQALFLMNSPMVIEAARKLVDRPLFADLKTDAERVAALYIAIYQRMPSRQEVEIGVRYVSANPTGTSIDLAPAAPVAASPAAGRAGRKAEAQAMAGKKGAPRFSNQVGGFAPSDSHAPIDAWTKLAHALFQSNEAMFYD
jgi:cytochrome c553